MADRILTTRWSARAVVLALVAAVLATLALVAGPLAQPARAAAFTPSTAAEFYADIATINADDSETHTITLANDIAFTDETPVALIAGNDVTIDGAGHRVYCADAGECGTWLVVAMPDDVFTLRRIVVEGFAPGVYVEESEVVIEESTFTGNGEHDSGETSLRGGGLNVINYQEPADMNSDGYSIHNTTLTDVNFFGNALSAEAGCLEGAGASIAGDVTITRGAFTNNSLLLTTVDDEEVCSVRGGALYLDDGIGYIYDTEFTGNSVAATQSDWFPGFVDDEPVVVGGAVNTYGGEYQFGGVTFTDNSATEAGGAVYAGFSELEFESTSMTGNAAQVGGGLYTALLELDIDYSTFDGNEATESGGAYFAYETDFGIVGSTFKNNRAEEGYGGGIEAHHATGYIMSSVFHDNFASSGGGIELFESNISIATSTVAENSASAGAGIALRDTDLSLQHATVARNTIVNPEDSADAEDLSQLAAYDAELSVFATALVEPLGGATNCGIDDNTDVYSDGFNAADDGSCYLDHLDDTEDSELNHMLGALQFNGGPTWTMLPDPDSDLVDAIDDEVCPEDESDNDDFDQRGVEREQGDGCDIGAVEILEPIVGTIVTPGGTVPWRMLNAVDADVVYQGVSGLSPAPPASVAFPYGALGSDIQVLANGWPADVQLYSPAPTTQVWKLFDGAWVNPPGATSVSGGGGTLWTFRLVDGGFGDNDGAADGTIHDPSALSVTAVFAG